MKLSTSHDISRSKHQKILRPRDKKNELEYQKHIEYRLFLAGIVFAAVVFAVVLFFTLTSWKIGDLVRVCYFQKYFGFYCPGCGGTRSAICFLQGHWLRAFFYHPFVLYCGLLYLLFMLRGFLSLGTRGRLPWMKFRYGYLYAGVAILIIQFLWKNIYLWNGIKWTDLMQ